MKKTFFICLILFCFFSFNSDFITNNFYANTEVAQEVVAKDVAKTLEKPDVLEEPVFQDEQEQTRPKKITGKLSSIIIKIFGGGLLLLVTIACLSFIFFANEQRRREKYRRKQGSNANVINAVDNFARHRIKK